jgi:ADP-ribose pyrophosphatase YjhB (NUDIX family)
MIDGHIKFCPHCATALTAQQHTGKLRPICPNCGWVYFPDPKVAVAVLIKRDNKVLFVQRRYDPQKGHWTLPSGFVDAGEDPKVAAVRECIEETGLSILDLHLLDVVYGQAHPHGASILIVYRAQLQAGEIIPGDDAVQAAFFDIHALPPLAFPSTQKILDLYF